MRLETYSPFCLPAAHLRKRTNSELRHSYLQALFAESPDTINRQSTVTPAAEHPSQNCAASQELGWNWGVAAQQNDVNSTHNHTRACPSLARRISDAAFLLILTASSLVHAQVPDAADFIRRNNHGSVAVGDFIYIDGGLYSKYVDGQVGGPFPNTKTLAINMRTSWTNKAVNITEIDKGNSPVFFQPQYWPDESSSSFYSWSGSAPSGYAVSEKSLWKFTADGKGGGSWARQSISESDSEFKKLTRPVGEYSAVVDRVGYYVGGYAMEGTDDVNFSGSDAIPVPGVVSYKFSSETWSNASSSGWNQYGTGMRGKATAVPFGNDGGLLVLLGGESGTHESISNERGYMDFSSVTIYDTDNQSWYSQTTTGEAPSTRDEFCMAAAKGENSTELFIFGCWTVATGVTHNYSYILSLPAFHWFKGPTNSSPRVGLTCYPVGSGRQVLVIGGQDNNNNTYRWENPDPWTQGLGIFDMTAMEWSDGYDAGAGAYSSPQVVKACVVKSGPRQLLLKPKAPASLFPGLKGWKRRELAGIVCDD
ncbi:hypothetical protein GTA08_BOTSDO00861 [Botryosphaeria dothidea]|uniref:Kelch repeat protein n=1 Tax=Botryosphaeria dothidea TaxID=55169 RepID=A0A8H4NFE0_9PEZI|nr:hypothetical protein GTA08_BOTSDO00861 [Botryosphaeria dothidea]